MAVSEHVKDKRDTGCKGLTYRIFVYDGFDIGAKLVEWYSVATSMFQKPEIKVTDGYRVWISDWEMA